MTAITLPDGRDLELEVTGPDDAPVLLFHHGTPGGSHQYRGMADEVHAHGHRLVTWSRAGYGASTRRPGRSVADEVDDARSVLDHLGVDDCLVAGWSGGGPHALACGALAADRVRGVLCIAGVAPYDADGLAFLEGMGQENHDEFGAALEGEEALRPYLEAARPELLEITGDQIYDQMASLIPPVDLESLTGEFGDFLAQEFRQAVSVGRGRLAGRRSGVHPAVGLRAVGDHGADLHLAGERRTSWSRSPTDSGSPRTCPVPCPTSSRAKAISRSASVRWAGCSTS